MGYQLATRGSSSTILSLDNPTGWNIPRSKSGTYVTPQSSLAFATVWACVNRKGDDIASLPFNIYERRNNGKFLATNHPLFHKLKKRPHQNHSAYNFIKALIVYRDLWGNGYAKIIRNENTGRPIAFQLKHPHVIEPHEDDDGNIVYHDYEDMEVVTQADMIHIKGLSLDGVKGKSCIKVARETVGLGIAQVDMGAEFYGNGTRTDGYIKYKVGLKKEQLKAIQSNWGRMVREWETPVIDNDSEYKEFGMPLTDAQYLENRKFQVEEIARMFLVPPHKIGHLEKASFSNITEQNSEYVINTLRPLAVSIEQEFDEKVFSNAEKPYFYTKIELNGLLRGNPKEQAELFRVMLDYGVYSVNDVRQLQDLNPVKEGDMRTMQLNRIPVEIMMEYYLNQMENGRANSNT